MQARRRRGQPERVSLDAYAWQRGLVVLVLALAVVVMHHVAGAHQHAAGPGAVDQAAVAPAAGAISSVGSAMAGTATLRSPTPASANSHAHGLAKPERHMNVPTRGGSEAAPTRHVMGMGMGMLMHLCLAVLGAALLLVALALLASGRVDDRRLVSRPWRPGSPARPPPVAERLAQLQVLRL